MGEVAASGGYWIAATADSVFAHAQTITGSIGVFSILPSVENALAEVGVQSDGVGTGPLSAALNPYGPLPETYARIAQASVQRTYTDFLNLVVRGRSLELADVQKIAEGRVWIGSKAKALGLVNEIGDLDAAIAHAAKLANVESPVVREFAPSVDLRDELLHELLALAPTPTNSVAAAVLADLEHKVEALEPMAHNLGAPWALCTVCTTLN